MSTERPYCGKHVFASGGTYRCVRPRGHEHGCAPTGTTEEWQEARDDR